VTLRFACAGPPMQPIDSPVLSSRCWPCMTFHPRAMMDWSAAWRSVRPATLGSVVGVYLAETLGTRQLGLSFTAGLLVRHCCCSSPNSRGIVQDYHIAFRTEPRLGCWCCFFVGVWPSAFHRSRPVHNYSCSCLSVVRIRSGRSKCPESVPGGDDLYAGADCPSVALGRSTMVSRRSSSPPLGWQSALEVIFLVRSYRVSASAYLGLSDPCYGDRSRTSYPTCLSIFSAKFVTEVGAHRG